VKINYKAPSFVAIIAETSPLTQSWLFDYFETNMLAANLRKLII